MKYRKKPVEVEAIQWTGLNSAEVARFVNADWSRNHYGNTLLVIPTLKGDMHVTKDDYIIKGVKGEFYCCKPDIFEATYEMVQTID